MPEVANNIESNNIYSSLDVEMSQEEKIDVILLDIKKVLNRMKSLEDANQVLHDKLAEKDCVIKEIQEKMDEREQEKDRVIKELEDKMDEREQRERNFALRVTNVSISKEEEEKFGHNVAAARAVFNKAMKPVLSKPGIKEKLDQPVNHWSDIIETAHILPNKDKKKGPQIIVKMKSRPVRNTILANRPPRKEGLPTMTADLTKRRYAILQKLIKSKKFKKVWILDGNKLRFTLPEGETVYTTVVCDKEPDEIMTDCKC